MKTHQANLLNSITLILMCLWAYLTFEGTIDKEQNMTAFIPLFFGCYTIVCVMEESKKKIKLLLTLLY